MQFKAGRYYVGDLCYVVKDWHQLLTDTDYFRNENCTFKDQPIFVAKTTYGDGTYSDQYSRVYPVDTGSIGIVPVELIDHQPDDANITDFAEDFEAYAREGVLYFGDVAINTNIW
ncbi:hypothetical protein CEB3_c13920 [Peptococcaceae bacterium CEB3]|nr:hypothetical protein CEB3_c13920 [Peptococcaceae bacterium CEB3]